MYPTFEDPTRIEEFFNDAFDSYFGTPISFLERYPEIDNYQQVIDAKLLAEKLSQLCLAANNEQIASLLSTIDADVAKRIKKVLKQKLGMINKMMVQRVLLGRTGNLLVGFNWNINLVVSHSNSTGCNVPICALELIIKEKFTSEERRVVIELEKAELASFVEKLKQIQKQLK